MIATKEEIAAAIADFEIEIIIVVAIVVAVAIDFMSSLSEASVAIILESFGLLKRDYSQFQNQEALQHFLVKAGYCCQCKRILLHHHHRFRQKCLLLLLHLLLQHHRRYRAFFLKWSF
jgi:hypothetical protein